MNSGFIIGCWKNRPLRKTYNRTYQGKVGYSCYIYDSRTQFEQCIKDFNDRKRKRLNIEKYFVPKLKLKSSWWLKDS